MSKLNLSHTIVAFQDAENTSAPVQKYVDWKRVHTGVAVEEVSVQRHNIAPGETYAIGGSSLSGVDAAASERYNVAPHPSKAGVYQVRAQGTALNALASTMGIVGAHYTFAPVGDGTCMLRCSDWTDEAPAGAPELWVFGGPFAPVKRGDRIYVPGASYGETGPFSDLNSGFWEVLRVGSYGGRPGSEVALRRVDPSDAVGASETVAVTDTLQIQRVNGSGPFYKALVIGFGSALYYSGVWDIFEAARGWFSIRSTADVVLPTLAGAAFDRVYLAREFVGYVRVESDRPVRVEFNSGGKGPFESIVLPVVPGDPKGMGWFDTYGFITGLSIHNIASEPAAVNVVTAIQRAA